MQCSVQIHTVFYSLLFRIFKSTTSTLSKKSAKAEPVPDGMDAKWNTQYIWHKTRHIPLHPHCAKNNQNHCIKTELFTSGADAIVYEYVRFIFVYSIWPRNQTNTVASVPVVTGSVFMLIFK